MGGPISAHLFRKIAFLYYLRITLQNVFFTIYNERF